MILGPIDLSVSKGEHWVMLGPNGSGKTTLLALAGARRQPSAGTVRVLGLMLGHGDVRTLHPRIGHCSGTLAEMLPSNMTAEEVVLTGRRSTFATWLQTYDDEDRRRVRDARRRRVLASGKPPTRHWKPG
jgi:iron complex transport system ATP-binding protein